MRMQISRDMCRAQGMFLYSEVSFFCSSPRPSSHTVWECVCLAVHTIFFMTAIPKINSIIVPVFLLLFGQQSMKLSAREMTSGLIVVLFWGQWNAYCWMTTLVERFIDTSLQKSLNRYLLAHLMLVCKQPYWKLHNKWPERDPRNPPKAVRFSFFFFSLNFTLG